MTPREIHAMLARMRSELANPLTKPESWIAFNRTEREQWRQKTEELFALIPDEAVPFAQNHAWHVFDDRAPGVLEQFILGVATGDLLKSTSITLHENQFAPCGAKDADHMMRILYALNLAWQTQMRVFAHYAPSAHIHIQFFAV